MGRRLPWTAVWSVARERLRRRRVATVALIALAGLSAAVPVAVWSASRYTSTAYERFVDAAQPSDTGLVVCPPGLELETDVGPGPCFEHTGDERARRDPGRPTGPGGRPLRLPHARHRPEPGPGGPDGRSPSEPSRSTTQRPSPPWPATRSSWPAGSPRPGAPDEAMISEPAVERLGVGAGDRVWVRFSGSDAELVPVTITGVVRTPTELLPLGEASSGPALLTRPGFLGREGSSVPGAVQRHRRVAATTATPTGSSGGCAASSTSWWSATRWSPPDEAATIIQATDFESRAGAAIAGAAALVALFFVGQAVSRQARSESLDAPTLVTLGLTRRDLLVASAVRWLGAGRARRGGADAGRRRRGLGPRSARRGSAGRVGPHAALRLAGVDRRRDRRCSRWSCWSDRSAHGPARATAAVPVPAPFGASSPSLATGLGLAWHGRAQGRDPAARVGGRRLGHRGGRHRHRGRRQRPACAS